MRLFFRKASPSVSRTMELEMRVADHPAMLENRAGLSVEALAELDAVVSRHRMLDDAIAWTLQQPSATVVEVVVQDEFTHDVIVVVDAPVHLVYSTT